MKFIFLVASEVSSGAAPRRRSTGQVRLVRQFVIVQDDPRDAPHGVDFGVRFDDVKGQVIEELAVQPEEPGTLPVQVGKVPDLISPSQGLQKLQRRMLPRTGLLSEFLDHVPPYESPYEHEDIFRELLEPVHRHASFRLLCSPLA